jgi:hypothetical protein
MISKYVKQIIDHAEKVITLSVGKGKNKKSLSFNYFETLNRINHYVNNEYLDGSHDIFWQIANPRVVHTAKNIDLDTKDLYPYADGDVSYLQTWILKMKFYRWLEDNHMALLLN